MKLRLIRLIGLITYLLIVPGITFAEHAHHSTLNSLTPSAKSIYNIDSSWTDQSGAELKLSSLAGKPVVVAMIYTSCEFACPLVVDMLKRVEKSVPDSMRDRVSFLLVTFDTERDTPERLTTYSTKRSLNLKHWKLVRGTADDTLELGVLLGVNYRKNEDGGFSHSNTITLLNSRGEIAAQSNALQGDIDKVTQALAVELKSSENSD